MDPVTRQWTILKGARQIGYGWQMRPYVGHIVTFQNRLTGRFSSKIALDRDHKRAVTVLSNTAAAVYSAADGLLAGDLASAAAP